LKFPARVGDLIITDARRGRERRVGYVRLCEIEWKSQCDHHGDEGFIDPERCFDFDPTEGPVIGPLLLHTADQVVLRNDGHVFAVGVGARGAMCHDRAFSHPAAQNTIAVSA